MTRIVLDLNDRRPVWRIPESAVKEIRESLPEGWKLARVGSTVDGTGDGAAGASPEVLDAVRGASAYVGLGIPAEVLRTGRGSLRWVHTAAAGVGSSLTQEMRESGVIFTNSAGIHGPPMAETIVGMLLYFFRGLDLAVEGMWEKRWKNEPFLRSDTPVRELSGATVGILGLGGIGGEVARRLEPLGVRILGWKRQRRGGEGGDREVRTGSDGLTQVLGESDAVVVSLPETAATRGLMDRDALAALPEGAVLVNVSRGRLVDTEALVDALRSGRLRGAALDVTDPEPLPDGHPLWSLPNVLITPHVSAVSRRFWRRQSALIVENLQRLVAGEPLRNRVDLEAGY